MPLAAAAGAESEYLQPIVPMQLFRAGVRPLCVTQADCLCDVRAHRDIWHPRTDVCLGPDSYRLLAPDARRPDRNSAGRSRRSLGDRPAVRADLTYGAERADRPAVRIPDPGSSRTCGLRTDASFRPRRRESGRKPAPPKTMPPGRLRRSRAGPRPPLPLPRESPCARHARAIRSVLRG